MRPSQKSTEERKWVLDTINKYFDVIVEEEDEDEEEEESDIDDSDDEEDDFVNSEIESSDSESDLDSLSFSDTDNKVDNVDAKFQSSSRMRELLKKAATNVSSSQSNLVNLNQVKEKLGSRINLGIRQSTDQLNCQ